ncbi:sensor histidine kinase [Leptospira sarikeiensis]|uniref:histidine kinase n=1 Tax=Leptospira sarikeiensis TaxID=2484943 RepID=A0A4R9KC39_9LEPT|nr:sensor histidine kinase [Leptospira sarikeiensis]TGL64493.1 histidine kinase [Leptospira sarikeiensis]
MGIFSKQVLLVSIFAIFFFPSCTPSPHKAPLENGVINWEKSRSQGECFRMTGDWKFAWLGEVPDRSLPKEPEKFNTALVPGSWKSAEWPFHSEGDYPKYGKALYRVDLFSDVPVESLHMIMFDQGTNYRILFNGKLINEVGKVGDPTLDGLELRTSYSIFPAWQGLAHLDVEISNYQYRKGGLWKPPVLGTADCVSRYYLDRRDLEGILCGGLFFLGLFHIFVSAFYKKDSSAFILGIFSITVGLRLYSTGVRLFPEHFLVGPEVYLRIEFITWFLGMPLAQHFLLAVFPVNFGKTFLKLGYIFAGVFTLITLFTGPAVYSYLINPSYLLFIFNGSCSLVVLIRAVKNQMVGAYIYLTGFIFLLFFLGSEILFHAEILDSWELSGIGVGVFVLGNSLSLSSKMLSGFREREKIQEILNTNLEELVKKRTRELEFARDEAEAANKAKSEFLINVDHEVRTPMNGIMGITQMLLDADLKPEHKEMLELLKRSGDAMMVILGSMLDASSLEKGTLFLLNKRFSLKASIYEAAMRVEDKIRAKNLEFGVTLSDNLPEVVEGDEERFKTMLLVLLENAEKFTARGFVRLTAEKVQETRLEYRLQFRVKDSGIGIPEDKLSSIFNPFQQVDSGVTKPFQGAGLGLALCKALAQKMDGDISVQSTPGKGSEFILEISLSKPEIQS